MQLCHVSLFCFLTAVLFVLLKDFLFGALRDTLTRSSVASEDPPPPCYFPILPSKVSRRDQRFKTLPSAASNVSE